MSEFANYFVPNTAPTNIFIGCCTDKSNHFYSRIIRWFDKGHASHLYVRCQFDYYEDDVIFHAHEQNQNMMDCSDFLDDYLVLDEFELNLDDEQKLKALEYCIDRSKRQYSMRSIIGIGINRLIGIPNYLWQNDRQTCPEYIYSLFKELFPDSDFWTADPRILGVKNVFDQLVVFTEKKLVRRIER